MNRPLFWLHGNPVTPIDLLLAIAVLVLVYSVIARLRRASAKLLSAGGEAPGTLATVTILPSWLIAAVGVLLALDLLNIHLPSAVLFAGLLAIAAAAALQPVMTALASGLLLRLERPFAVGDRITVGKIEGDVKALRPRSIVLRTPDNALVSIPNIYLTSMPIVNWSTGDRKLRLRIRVAVAHGADLKKTTTVLQRAAESSSRVVKSPAPRVLLRQSGKSGHQFEIWAWISGPGDRSWARNELYRAIDAELRKANLRSIDGRRSADTARPAEATPEAFESHSRESRVGRERKRREGNDRRTTATEQPTESAPVEDVQPAATDEREAFEEARTPISSEPSEERPPVFGRSKRRTPRR